MIPTRSQAQPCPIMMLFLRDLCYFLNFQLSSTPAARILARIRPALARIRLPAIPANQQISHRQRPCGAGQRAAMTGRADLDEQCLEIRVAMFVPAPLQVQVVMAQFVLDNRFRLLPPVNGQLMRTDFDMVALGEISPACRPQSRIERGLVPERHSERRQRNFLHPLLQLLIVHVPFSPDLPRLLEL